MSEKLEVKVRWNDNRLIQGDYYLRFPHRVGFHPFGVDADAVIKVTAGETFEEGGNSTRCFYYITLDRISKYIPESLQSHPLPVEWTDKLLSLFNCETFGELYLSTYLCQVMTPKHREHTAYGLG